MVSAEIGYCNTYIDTDTANSDTIEDPNMVSTETSDTN